MFPKFAVRMDYLIKLQLLLKSRGTLPEGRCLLSIATSSRAWVRGALRLPLCRIQGCLFQPGSRGSTSTFSRCQSEVMVENLIILSFDPFMCVYVQVRSRSVRVTQEKFPSSGTTSADGCFHGGFKLYFTNDWGGDPFFWFMLIRKVTLKRSFVHKWTPHLHICPLRSWKYESVGCNLWRSVFFFLHLLICWPGTKLWVPAAFVRRGAMWDTLLSLAGVLQVDGFHCVILSLYTDPSHFWTPPRQELAHSLPVANGFLIESPQVVYLLG